MMKSSRNVLKIAALSLGVVIAVLLVIALMFCSVKFIAYKSIKDTGMPKIYINTENGKKITSKEDYVNCTVSLSGTDEEYCFEDVSAGVRGRGNNSWKYYPKKPYRVKFDEKISLFGEAKNKSWVLLAMYSDFSYMKDLLAFRLADSIGTDAFVPSYHYVELYLNGKYNGLYLLTDQVDENSGRSDVKEDFDETATEVPFLVELDAYAPDEGEEGVDWFYVSGYAYNIKYPEADERYTAAQFEYIKNYIESVDSLCRKADVSMSELSEFIDIESFIDYYIVSEVMGQMEINWKSVYMSKKTDGKLKMGPLWDFDWSITGSHASPSERDVYKDNYEGLRSQGNWFDALIRGSGEFREALSLRWSEVRGILLNELSEAEADKDAVLCAAEKDFLRWHWYVFYKGPEACSDEVVYWCKNRIIWLDTVFIN